ncbi:MAG TPA: response regulator [Candidatus Margulisiibacteriota bacterium]|nr:response regulator [Candidatus Margulisiibacteriota bacterium]
MAKKILLVDDDAELCQEVASILRDEGYEVDNTSHSLKGRELICLKEYDTYLFDYKMTDLNGIELLRIAKEKNPSGKVFIISGRSFIGKLLKEEGVLNLVSGVITKPFDIEVLLQNIGSSF